MSLSDRWIWASISRFEFGLIIIFCRVFVVWIFIGIDKRWEGNYQRWDIWRYWCASDRGESGTSPWFPCKIDGRMVVLLGVAQHIAGYGRIGMKISIPLAFPFCLVERSLIETGRV